MFLSALLISACNNQNGTFNGVDNDPTVNIKNKIGEGNTNDNFPATPEPIPPGKGEIVIEPMPLPKKEDQYTVVYETEKYEKRKALLQAIKFHNNEKELNEPSFPSTLKPEEVVPGKDENENNINLTNEIEIKNDLFVVKFTVDYGSTIDEKDNFYFWEYEVTNEEVKLLDKG